MMYGEGWVWIHVAVTLVLCRGEMSAVRSSYSLRTVLPQDDVDVVSRGKQRGRTAFKTSSGFKWSCKVMDCRCDQLIGPENFLRKSCFVMEN